MKQQQNGNDEDGAYKQRMQRPPPFVNLQSQRVGYDRKRQAEYGLFRKVSERHSFCSPPFDRSGSSL